MKILHTSDLHLGMLLMEIPLLPYQKSFCRSLCEAAEQADAVIIAGDVFDTSVASAEAIRCWSGLASAVCLERKLPLIVCAGNHDGAARLSSCSDLLRSAGLFISGAFEDGFTPVSVGNADIYALPYFNPSDAAVLLDCKPTAAAVMEAAVKKILSKADKSRCNILAAHCFAAGGKTSDSDLSAKASESVGGADMIPLTAFDGFDYVALGHLHGPQNVGRNTVRYCGTPLKYSFSETGHKKSVTVLDIREKGNINVYESILCPLRDMRELYGSYSEITLRKNYVNTNREDYLHITLTDENPIPDAISKLRVIYPNIMKLDYDNARTRQNTSITVSDDIEVKSPLDLFAEFYEQQNNREMTSDERNFTQALIDEIWNGGDLT